MAMKWLVSVRYQRKMMRTTGGPAEAQNKLLQPWGVVGTNALYKVAEIKYPNAYPCWNNPDIIPLASYGRSSRAVAAADPNMPSSEKCEKLVVKRDGFEIFAKPAGRFLLYIFTSHGNAV
ncbi:hypothetical protein ACKS0A_07632 [Histoplasma ohiense]